MIKMNNPADCSGCTACASICGHNAITMQEDRLGFKYPRVDESKCTECGLCEKVCPFNDSYDVSQNFDRPVAYGARLKDDGLLMESQSGGAFAALSDTLLEQGGIVYGAGYDTHFRVIHKRATTPEERNEMKGSKYVQSDMGDIFRQVRADLIKGNKVLFSGTPCQTAGLHSFIPPRLRENLILVDLICHGVPSPALWNAYVSYIEAKHKDQLIRTNFRDKKSFGWRVHKETFRFANKGLLTESSYTYLFYKHVALRESCFECKYCNLKRPSDITIADFWGCENTNKTLADDQKGVSIMLCNTPKGAEVFDQAKKSLLFFPVELEKMMQPNLQHPVARPSERTTFESDFESKGLKYVMHKYGQDSASFKVKRFLRRYLGGAKGMVFNFVKKLMKR